MKRGIVAIEVSLLQQVLTAENKDDKGHQRTITIELSMDCYRNPKA